VNRLRTIARCCVAPFLGIALFLEFIILVAWHGPRFTWKIIKALPYILELRELKKNLPSKIELKRREQLSAWKSGQFEKE
jgi:hypothetical protein